MGVPKALIVESRFPDCLNTDQKHCVHMCGYVLRVAQQIKGFLRPARVKQPTLLAKPVTVTDGRSFRAQAAIPSPAVTTG
jgi:hypothetical protein